MSKITPTDATLDLTAGTEETTGVTIRPRREDESILPAEDWCPYFVYYTGTTSAKFTDGQIETIARQGAERGWCNLCDAPIEGDRERHVKQHLRDLHAWRKARGAVIDKERAARLREARKAKQREKDAEAIAAAPIARPRTRKGR